MIDKDALIKRLNHAIVTASNDDLSKPNTEKRQRHLERIDTIADAIEFIAADGQAVKGTKE